MYFLLKCDVEEANIWATSFKEQSSTTHRHCNLSGWRTKIPEKYAWRKGQFSSPWFKMEPFIAIGSKFFILGPFILITAQMPQKGQTHISLDRLQVLLQRAFLGLCAFWCGWLLSGGLQQKLSLHLISRIIQLYEYFSKQLLISNTDVRPWFTSHHFDTQ